MAYLETKDLRQLRIILASLLAVLLVVFAVIVWREIVRHQAMKHINRNAISIEYVESAEKSTEAMSRDDVVAKQRTIDDHIEKDIDIIWDFYEYVLQLNNEQFDIKKYLSTGLARRIWTNDYSGCYQIWVFRTGVQDGNGVSKLVSILPEGNDWYEVKYEDMGMTGRTSVHVSNGRIDDYVAFNKAYQL